MGKEGLTGAALLPSSVLRSISFPPLQLIYHFLCSYFQFDVKNKGGFCGTQKAALILQVYMAGIYRDKR